MLLEGKTAVIYGGGAAVRSAFLTWRAAAPVVTLRTGRVPETIPDTSDPRMQKVVADLGAMTMLGRCATLEDVGDAAAFAASDRARTMTAATINVSCGALVD
jgi:3-oxoacyl-[acyl-carrier protein] reductase